MIGAGGRKCRRSRLRVWLAELEFESVVAVTVALVLADGGVDLGCGVGYFAEAVAELDAPLE